MRVAVDIQRYSMSVCFVICNERKVSCLLVRMGRSWFVSLLRLVLISEWLVSISPSRTLSHISITSSDLNICLSRQKTIIMAKTLLELLLELILKIALNLKLHDFISLRESHEVVGFSCQPAASQQGVFDGQTFASSHEKIVLTKAREYCSHTKRPISRRGIITYAEAHLCD